MVLVSEGEHVRIGHMVVGYHQTVFGNEAAGTHEIDGHDSLGHGLDGRFSSVYHPHSFVCREIGRKSEAQDKNEERSYSFHIAIIIIYNDFISDILVFSL